jgi:hypothetical protein
MAILYWVLIFIGLVTLGILIWRSASDWNVTSMVMLVLTFLLMAGLLPLAALSLKARSTWQREVKKLTESLARLETENRQTKYGNPNDPNSIPLGDLQTELVKLQVEVGRVWRGMQVAGPPVGSTIPLRGAVVAANANPQVPGAANPPANPAAGGTRLVADLVVHAFAEFPDPAGEQRSLPTIYLGPFNVQKVDGENVSLEPAATLSAQATQLIANGSAVSWALYEQLPKDVHDAFLEVGAKPDEDSLFGKVNETLINQAFQASPEVATIVPAYLEDGKRVADVDVTDPRYWVLIRFNTDAEANQEIAVDSASTPPVDELLRGTFFDSQGTSIDPRLRMTTKGVKFSKGDEIALPYSAAVRFITGQGGAAPVADVISKHLVRPLNNYGAALIDIPLTTLSIKQRIAVLNQDLGKLTQALERTQELLVAEQVLKNNLETEFAQVTKEADAVKDYTVQIQERMAKTKAELIRLFESNRKMRASLADIQTSLARIIDQRTVSAAP